MDRITVTIDNQLIEEARQALRASTKRETINRAATNGIITVEIVAYATRDADSLNVRSDLSGCHWLELTAPVFELAVAIA